MNLLLAAFLIAALTFVLTPRLAPVAARQLSRIVVYQSGRTRF